MLDRVASDGMTFTGAARVASGTPAGSGNWPRCSRLPTRPATLLIDRSLNINNAGSGVSINSSSNLGTRTTGQSYSNQFSASGTVTWSVVVVAGEESATGTNLSGSVS